MIIKFKIFKILLISSFFLFACQDDIEINLPEGETQIVVDAFLGTNYMAQSNLFGGRIYLNKSTPYTDNLTNTNITDAEISVKDINSNRIIEFEYIEGYGYVPKNSYIPYWFPFPLDKWLKADSTYELTIEMTDGTTIKSNYLTVPKTPEIDSIYYVTKEVASKIDPSIILRNNQDYYYMIQTKDDSSANNFYRWSYSFSFPTSDIYQPIFSDKLLIPGAYLPKEITLFDFPVSQTSTLSIYQYSLTEEVFDYITNLKSSLAEGTPFDTPPGPIKNNLYMVGHPEIEVLGMFSISDVTRISRAFKKEEVIDYYPFN